MLAAGPARPGDQGAPDWRNRVRLQASAPPQRSPASRQREIVILIAATIVAFAFVWYVSLRAAAMSRGGLNVLARAAFLIMTCLACIVIGFFLPMAPVVSALIGSAFWAGLLATAGALVGMSLSDAVLARLETNKSDAGSLAARDDRRPR
jgi:hypothetical protein